MNKPWFFTVIIIVLVVIGGIVFLTSHKDAAGKYDAFAQCLGDQKVIFYGTFWCPHCQNQKTMFGTSSKLLPYVECSTTDGRRQQQICKDKNIEGYPTWEFADDSRETGEISLKRLSEKSGCPLPQAYD